MLNLKETSQKDNNQKQRSKTARNFYTKSSKVLKDNQLAVEETKKLYQKYYEMPNPLFISQLKTDSINIYLSNYKLNDVSVINKILSKYNFTKHLTLSPIDPGKTNKKSKVKNSREPITEGEKVKLDKEQKDKQLEYAHLINKITLGVGKHIGKNPNLQSFSLLNLEIDQKLAHNLSYGICNNKSIKKLKVNNCKMDIESYETLLKGLFNHEKIEYLDLQNNELGDKYGNMIGRIISRQTDRRDQLIWLSAIRNEFPDPKEFGCGLISINLNANNLSSYAADCMTTALALDQYVRSIILTNNKFDTDDCKKFVYMLRRNMTLLNIDLKSNPGFNDNIQKRLIIKMSKNIKNLYLKYKNNEMSGEDFEKYKKFINSSLFFNIDIPEEVIDNYNSNNLNKITEDNGTNIDNKIKNDNKNKENGMVLKEVNNENNINNKYNNKRVNNIKSKNKGSSVSPKKLNKSSDEENKKLIEENLLLKKKILKLEADKIKNNLGQNIKLPNKYKKENLNSNFKQAQELLDKLNVLMDKMENEPETKKIQENKKNIDNLNNKSDNKIKIKNIVLNDKKTEDIKNNKEKKKEKEKTKEKSKERAKEKPKEQSKEKSEDKKKPKEKEKEKKEIKLNLDDNNNKNIFKKEDNSIKKNKKQINNNINKDKMEDNNINKINNKNIDLKENLFKNNNNNKKEENNIVNNKNKINSNKKEEEKENEEIDNLDENEEAILLQHKLLFEHLKQQYEAKGMKFELEDFYEFLQNQGELGEEEEEEYEGF